jgi:hypothetical protein
MEHQTIAEEALYCPSATWNQFLQNLPWNQDTKTDSAYKAFQEAIRRGISRSDVFFDVAEAIHRSYCAVNWGVLNWNWKLALQDSNQDPQSKIPAPTPKPPPPSSFQRSLPPVNGKGGADHHFQHNGTEPHNGTGYQNGHNGAKYPQRRGSSLVSYYE